MGKRKPKYELTLESIEDKVFPALVFSIDYSKDTGGFFQNPPAGEVLDKAAEELATDPNPPKAITPGGKTWPGEFTGERLVLHVGGTDIGDPTTRGQLEKAWFETAIRLAYVEMRDQIIASIEAGGLESIEAKQRLARAVNHATRRYGLTFSHPETGEPCTMLALGDKAGGRFMLENRKTKKRSHSTKDPRLFLDYPLIRIPADW